jgi:hypothetical protein
MRVAVAWTAEYAQLGAVYTDNRTVWFAAPLGTAVGAFGGVGQVSGGRYVIENVYDGT